MLMDVIDSIQVETFSFEFRLIALCLYELINTYFFLPGVTTNKNGTKVCGEGCGREFV